MDQLYPRFKGIKFEPIKLIADDVTPTVAGQNVVPAGAKVVEVVGVQNDANDWIELPSLQAVENGHEILILANAGANFEIRTPASSAQEINSEDCDGTKELLATDTHVIRIVKINNTIGWMSNAYTQIGAVVTAVVPD